MTSDSSPAAEGTSGSSNSYSQRTCLPSPWAQVVRGGSEPETVAPRSPSASSSSVLPEQNLVVSDQLTVTEPQTAAVVETHPEGSNNGNASGVKKSAWNKPSPNGGVEGSSTPVMGAASWPALSDVTKALPKSLSTSESSSKPTSDGSVNVSQAPVISHSQQQLQRPVRPNANHNSNQNHGHPVRQRSMKRGGGGGGGYNRPPPPPPQPPTPPPMPRFPLYDMPYRGFVPAVMDASIREQSPYNGNTFAPRPMGHSNAMNDHNPQSRRRNNFGPRPRGDGGHYLNNGHGSRRDHHDREWRGPQNHAAIQPPLAPPPPPPPRGYMQQAHLGTAPFIAPQPIRPYGTPMGYEMATPFLYVPSLPSEPYRGATILPRAPPPMFIPIVDTPLTVKILQQIEYYFSETNLEKDDYLKSNMDEEGWVPLSLIAGFRRVQSLTSDIPLILSSLRDSVAVEVQGENIRSRKDWQKYVKSSNNDPLPEASLHTITLNDPTPGETSISGPAGSLNLVNDDQSMNSNSNQDL